MEGLVALLVVFFLLVLAGIAHRVEDGQLLLVNGAHAGRLGPREVGAVAQQTLFDVFGVVEVDR